MARSVTTATEAMLMLNQPALCALIKNHFILRQFEEELDPVLLTGLAHHLLDLASQAERNQLRKERETKP